MLRKAEYCGLFTCLGEGDETFDLIALRGFEFVLEGRQELSRFLKNDAV